MNYFLTAEEIEVQQRARKFAREFVAPQVAELDKDDIFPAELLGMMGKEGFLGLFVPREYGGSGGGVMALSLAAEEIARVCCGVATAYAANALATFPIMLFGSEEQKKKYLTPVAQGKVFAAFALTEPNAGSDAASIQTTATRDGDSFLLNGNKQWITNAGEAGTYTVFASSDRSRGPRGITAFIIKDGAPGFSFGKKEEKLGIRCSSTRVLTFENCRVPMEDVLGPVGGGFLVAMRTFDKARPGVGAEALGVAQGAFDKLMEFMQEEQKVNREFTLWQSVQGKLAELATRIEATRALVYAVAKSVDAGDKNTSTASAMAKLYASETAMIVSQKAMEIAGEFGVDMSRGLEKYMRDAKILEIYEGTNEIQREIIALGLVREYKKVEKAEPIAVK